jgi:predicted nucleotidyltransferase
MAIRGVSRATADVDILCVDATILRREAWADFEARGLLRRVLKGDPGDPLAGSLRLAGDSDVVDVVVGRDGWQREIIEAAELLPLGELSVAVARPAGLVLLKLHAGGAKDAWDIRSLLEVSDDAAELAAEVERMLPRLPTDARRLWSRLRAETQG